MINENEIQISNMSYTEKDFASIYPALLDLVKQLTNKWDPSISNESDPGNVLLKLLAAVGDKNNYNIDKNVLECFMPSATQETSMRMLTEAVGYNMKYYQSAVTDISFKYTGEMERPLSFTSFNTVVSNKDGSVAYTLIEDVTLSVKNMTVSGQAIEGQLNDVTVGDSNIIKLDNLDDNNRLYFPETYVAENGVFITNNGLKNFKEWTRVDNLNTQQPLTRCYKFGFDSQAELPYIEFPTDIAQLIGSGILVSYIVTTADAGNVSAGILTQVSSTSTTDFNADELIVFNPSAAINGKSKETIDEAYNNFKRIIGTFDTLVTTRDYSNAMYNLEDEYNNPLVSNATASDRTNDINYGLKVVTYDQQGQYTELIPNTDMASSDITLYPLSPYKGENYNVYNPNYVYDESYRPLKVESNNLFLDDEVLVSDLDELKCIGHTFKKLPSNSNIIYNFLNIATLDAQIFTYSKVNKIAQADIKANVLKALSDNFNARMVDYGYEIPYDKLLDVIYSADPRIKLVNLSEPVYKTNILYPNGDIEGILESGGDVITNVIAKNVLAGKISLFLYDERFDWRFGQTDIESYDNIEKMTTALVVNPANSSTGTTFNYTLRKNEVFQLISPNLTTTTIYPAGVYYRFTSTGSDASSTAIIIGANTDYKLLSNQSLQLYYVDSDEVAHNITLDSGTIIRPNFDMGYTQDNSASSINVNNVYYNKINTNKTLEIRDFITITLDNIGTPLYWIRKNENNVLFDTNEMTTVLDADEYFIYSNTNFDDLTIVGAGTKITRVGDTEAWAINNTISTESINLNGVSAFKQSDWQYKNLGAEKYVELQEMQIITLGEDATLTISNWGNMPSALSSDWVDIDADATIAISLSDGTYQVLSNLDYAGINWQLRTRLDLDGGPDNPQVLYEDNKSGQYLVLSTTSGGDAISINGTSSGVSVLFNYPLQMAGGENLDMKVTNVLLGTSSYALSVCKYISKPAVVTIGSEEKVLDTSSNINIALDEDKTIKLPLSIDYIETEEPTVEEMNDGVVPYNYQPYGTYIVPILFTQGSESTSANPTSITITSNCAKVYEYNEYNTTEPFGKKELTTITKGGLYNLELVAIWQGEYPNLTTLQSQRPEYAPVVLDEQPSDWVSGNTNPYYTNTSGTHATTFVPGNTYYVKPNVTGDKCLVGNTIYQWSGSAWTATSTISSDFNITLSATIDDEQPSQSFISIGQIHKILNINPSVSTSISGDMILQEIRTLTDDTPVKFYYTYEPENSDVIETEDLLDPSAFWNVNNIANRVTLPKLDLENSNIYIARASQL